MSYGALRYAGASPEVAERLRSLPAPEISINYLGRSPAGAGEVGEVAAEPTGATRSLRGRRHHLLEVNGGVQDGCLAFDWWYSRAVHRRATVQQLADRFAASLRAIAAAGATDAPRLAAEFAKARATDEDLARLLARLDEGGAT
jgi:non-ribosomal peptide synthase protein (TIGR01720 family)